MLNTALQVFSPNKSGIDSADLFKRTTSIKQFDGKFGKHIALDSPPPPQNDSVMDSNDDKKCTNQVNQHCTVGVLVQLLQTTTRQSCDSVVNWSSSTAKIYDFASNVDAAIWFLLYDNNCMQLQTFLKRHNIQLVIEPDKTFLLLKNTIAVMATSLMHLHSIHTQLVSIHYLSQELYNVGSCYLFESGENKMHR